MSENDKREQPAPRADFSVNENPGRVDVAESSTIRPGAEGEPIVAAGGPTNWWRAGIIAIVIVAALLFALQMLGGWPGTDVQPGTPVAEPQNAPG